MEKVFYFAEVLDSIKFVSTLIGVVIGIIALIVIILSCCTDFDEDERIVINKAIKLTVPIATIFTIVAIVCPTKKTYIYMNVGKYVDETAITNPEVKELPENAILLLNEYVKRELKEIKEEDNEYK